ncbi:hypothetical protein [Streptomyces sp. RFCAC02]|uniref:hypothetical protein n=1 Tax=Streptomyces sp. RFCAC02 TaxID=2499143 RepID=UPI00101F95F4|nr:hypothetical protein [Streptomyces sp. RFCAC02]
MDPTGIELTLGGRAVRYFPGGAAFEPPEDVRYLDPVEDGLLERNPRVRRILFTPFPALPPVVLYLHWSDGGGLPELDARVVAREAGDEDFGGAVTGQTVTRRCRACAARFAVLYSVDFPGFPDMPRRLAGHRHIPRCPACDARWTAYVLEVIRRLPDA